MALKHLRECPGCNKKLFEGGRYCPHCTFEFEEPLSLSHNDLEQIGFEAYCQHCFPRKALLETHRHCPYCSKPMHLYIGVFERLEWLVENVQVDLQFLIKKAGATPATILAFTASCQQKKLQSGTSRIYANSVLVEEGSVAHAEFMFNPGTDTGKRIIDIEIHYRIEEQEYRVSGAYAVVVRNEKRGPEQVNVHVGGQGHVVMDDLVIQGHSEETSFNSELLKQLKEGGESRYVPLECRQARVEMHVEPEQVELDMPSWPEHETASIRFNLNGTQYNYALLSKSSLVFGRGRDESDVRLYEVEHCMANLARQEREGIAPQKRTSGSHVSGVQWQLEPTENGIQVTQFPGRSSLILPGKDRLEKGKSRRLGRNESIEIPERLGLCYAANAPNTSEVQAVYEAALERVRKGVPQWTGEYGGYRLDRLYSLCEDLPKGVDDFRTIERYILMPGWCTIGSSNEACIVVPHPSVAPIHAYLLFAGGYFFIAPEPGASVYVNDNAIRDAEPVPVRFEDNFRVGNIMLTFETFAQMYV